MSTSATMRAVRVHTPGDANAMQLESIPVPSPGLNEALVRVEYAGVNFIDVYKRTGLYKVPLPSTVGEEGAGVVERAGDGVIGVAPGDRVAWTSIPGAYAEYAVVAADRLVPVPANVELRTAAAVMLQGMTAHYLTTSTYPVKDGDRVLIHAAAGGAGLLLVQMAKRRGAFVIGTAGSEEKIALAKAAGADEVIDYTQQDFVAEVQRITAGKRLQVIYDSVGKTTFLRGLDLLMPRGMMVSFGQSSGTVDAMEPLVLSQKGSLYLTRPTLAHYIATREELLARAEEVFKWIEVGSLTVRVGVEFGLGEAGDAHRALEGRQTTGKVVLRAKE